MQLIVRIRGGMGNQLFIISAAIYVAKKLKINKLVFDIREYNSYKLRKFMFDKIALKDFDISYYTKGFNLKFDTSIFFFRIAQFVFKKTFKKNFNNSLYWFNLIFTHHKIDDDNLVKINVEKDIFMFGYFQDYRLVEFVAKEMKIFYEFIKDLAKIDKYIVDYENTNTLAISFRKGKDYIKNGLDVSDKNFYIRGLRKFSNLYSTVILFSDIKEIDYNEYFQDLNENIKIISLIEESIYTQFYYMSISKYFIIPNSSFSWWSAYFSSFNDKLCFVPSKWVKGKTNDSLLKTYYMVIDNDKIDN